MMTSSEWTKAIFVRHPKPRLLSAFLDKAINHTEHFDNFACPVYQRKGGDLEECIEMHVNFSFFLHKITTVLSNNVHWRSIFSRIDEKWWPSIDFVGNMENLSQDTEIFLKSLHSKVGGVSAWDRVGKTGWGDSERDCRGGTSAFLGERDNGHQTNARDKMLEYYTPSLEIFVESHYADDLNNRYFHFEEVELYPRDDGYYAEDSNSS